MLTAITFLPLLGAIIVLFIRGDVWVKRFATIWSVIPLVLSIILWIAAPGVGTVKNGFEEFAPWIPAIGVNYHLGVDGLSIPLIFLTTLLTTLGLFYSARTINERVKEFFALFLLLETGMLGVFVSLDLFLFYVFWEVGLVPMYFLIGVWGHTEDRPQYSAIKFFLFTLFGSVFMLLAFIAIYLNTGSFDITVLSRAKPFADNLGLAMLAFWGIWLAFSIKVPLFPFHTWLPDAHTAAPTAGSVVLAGILLKLGTYGYVRILLPFFPQVWTAEFIPGTGFTIAHFIALLAVISIVYGALVAMAQMDFKRLIAYSSVNHMGYVILGVAAAASLGAKGLANSGAFDNAAIAINGATLQMFNHGIITGALFFIVGMLYERAHTRDLKAFGGLGARVPVYGAILLTASLASLGLPGLAGFVSEFLVFRGAYGILTAFTVVALFGILFTAAMFLWKVIQNVLLGPLNEKWASLADMYRYEIVTLAPLIFFMVLVGVYPNWILSTINAATTAILKLIGA